MTFPLPRTWICALLILCGLSHSGLLAYEEPDPSRVKFDPAGIVLDAEKSERIPKLLLALAVNYPKANDNARAKALAIAMRLNPDDAIARNVNADLRDGRPPERIDIEKDLEGAISELWKIALETFTTSVSAHERQLCLYLTSIVIAYADEKDPRYAQPRKIIKEKNAELWKGVL